VHASITGAVKLRDLDKHLNRHSAKLHIAHRWEQAPQIRAVAIRSNSQPLMNGRAEQPSVLVSPKTLSSQRDQVASNAAKEVVRNRIKAKSIKLVNKDQLLDMLDKI